MTGADWFYLALGAGWTFGVYSLGRAHGIREAIRALRCGRA